MTPTLSAYIAERVRERAQVSPERCARLDGIVAYIRAQQVAGRPAQLNFICTHNSRRSHVAQLWAQTAASHYGVAGVLTFSGGTEATAFDARAVAAMGRAGFLIEKAGAPANPFYLVRWSPDVTPMVCFSKPYHSPPNPSREFCAVLVCAEADARCPAVAGAAARVALPYDDPKAFDGTELEAAKYDERCRDIAREMLWVFGVFSGA